MEVFGKMLNTSIQPYIAVAHDDGWTAHAAVTLLSVLEHTPQAKLFSLVPRGFKQAAALQRAVGPQLTIVPMDRRAFAGLKLWDGGHESTYYRLAIGSVLPAPRVLFLDCDMIVLQDVTPLWQTDLAGATVGAVPDVSAAGRHRLELPHGAPYFNAGLLLIDLDRWRQEDVGSQAASWARNNPDRLTWGDQCALNWTLRDRWHALAPEWNMQSAQFGRQTRWGFRFSRTLAAVPGPAPAIVHFSSPPAFGRFADSEGKPWMFLCEHPLRDAYRRIAARTTWGAQPPPDRYPHNQIRRALRHHASWALPAYTALRRFI